MARTASESNESANVSAAVMARTLPTIISACSLPTPFTSASAIFRADAERFSICELAADSERSSTSANGAIPPPNSASKDRSAIAASSATAATTGDSGINRSAMSGVTAAR